MTSRATCRLLRVSSPRLLASSTCQIQARNLSYTPVKEKGFFEDMRILKSFKNYISRTSDKDLHRAGLLHSAVCLQGVNVRDFFEYFDMPDTFNSWFLVTELHIYMLSNRFMLNHTHEGKVMMRSMQETMWVDVEQRLKRLAFMESKDKKHGLAELSSQFGAAVLIYDLGFSADEDKELANALWRRFFECQTPNGPQMELLIKYVRKTMVMLDEMPTTDLIAGETIKWLKLDEVNIE